MNKIKTIKTLKVDLHHKGDLIIDGDIDPGVKLIIEGGGVIIKGNVSNNVSIQQINSNNLPDNIKIIPYNNENKTKVKGGQIKICSNTKIIGYKNELVIINPINLTKENNKFSNSKLNGIEINGDTANKVYIKSYENLKATNIGDNATIEVIDNITVCNVGCKSVLNAGGNINCLNIDKKSKLDAIGYIEALNIGAEAQLSAYKYIKAVSADPTAVLDSGEGIKIPGCVVREIGNSSYSLNLLFI